MDHLHPKCNCACGCSLGLLHLHLTTVERDRTEKLLGILSTIGRCTSTSGEKVARMMTNFLNLVQF